MQSNHENYVAYHAAADNLLKENGMTVSPSVIFDRWLQGTPVADLLKKAKDKTLSFEEKLGYVKEELARKYERQEEIKLGVMGLIQSANSVLEGAGEAADRAETLISAFNKSREYKTALTWFETMTANGVDAPQQYVLASNAATRALAQAASSVDSYSTSAQANLERRAQVAAKAEIVSLFADMASA